MLATGTQEIATGAAYESLSRRSRRWLLARSLLRAAAITTSLMALYAVLPLDERSGPALVLNILVAIGVLGVVIALNVWGVLRSSYPRLRALDAAAAVVPLLLVLFAATYVQIEAGAQAAFSEPLSRVDAMYFTVTVLSTVGFGDIAPVATSARVVAMVQMISDLVLFGLFAKLIAGAMTEGLRRKTAEVVAAGSDPGSGDGPRAGQD